MSGILHMPQGGAQIKVISQIPETLMSGDLTVQEMLDTLGQYTYVIDQNNDFHVIQYYWDNVYVDNYEWIILDPVNNGSMCLINGATGFHSGLNFQPQARDNSQNFLTPVKAMFINRVLDFASDRVISTCALSEGSWTSTEVKVHLIPYDQNKTTAQYISMLLDHMNGAENGVYTMSFVHNGTTGQNDIEGIMLGELPNSGKYLVGIETSSSQNNATPSIYKLQFRTY